MTEPTVDQAALRDRIVAAIKSSPFQELRTVDHAANGPLQITIRVDDLADVLVGRLTAVLSAPADRAAVLREAAEHLLALSEALGLGTGAPWDAIHDRVTELGLPPLGQDPVARRLGLVAEHRAAVLRAEQAAELANLRTMYDAVSAREGDLIDERDQLLEARSTDRAAVLDEAADRFDQHATKILEGVGDKAVFVAKALRDQAAVWSEAAETLRRMAAEARGAQQDEAAPAEDQGDGPTWSDVCPHCKRWYTTSEPGAHEATCPMKPAAVQQPKEA